jgi:hypothetical protein
MFYFPDDKSTLAEENEVLLEEKMFRQLREIETHMHEVQMMATGMKMTATGLEDDYKLVGYLLSDKDNRPGLERRPQVGSSENN